MPTRSPWALYVKNITGAAPQHEIAERSGITAPVLSRWLSGAARPRAEQAIKLARAYERPPVEALIAAGYLDPAEVELAPPPMRSPRDYSNAELVAELEHDWHERRRGAAHFEGMMREAMRRLVANDE